MPTVSTRPPNRLGEMLSTCSEPLETFSPCIANCSSSILDSGLSSSAFAATTAATAEAAEPPRPLPSGMPLSMNASNPKPGLSASCMASSARPAVFVSGSRGMSFTTPEEPVITTPGLSVRVDRDLVAEHVDREAEDVESDGDVRRRRRRERRRLSLRGGAHRLRSEIRAHAQQIGEHAGGRDLGARARALHDQRIAVVTRGGVAHDVVGERDVRERMRLVELGHADRGLAVGREPAHVPQHLAARGRRVETLLHLAVVLRAGR